MPNLACGPADQAVEVYVFGQQPTSAATEQTLRQKDFELRPTTTPSDILRLVPGLFIAQHQGGGKADQIFLRGFDADHGTDVAVFIYGIPVNFVSHGHGQGYADLHWLSRRWSITSKSTKDRTSSSSAISKPQARSTSSRRGETKTRLSPSRAAATINSATWSDMNFFFRSPIAPIINGV